MHAAAPTCLQITHRASSIQFASNTAQQHEQPPVAPQLNRIGILNVFRWVNKEKKRKDYAFWRQFNEKPSIIPGCPGWVINTAVYTCRGGTTAELRTTSCLDGSEILIFGHAEVAWEEPPPRQMLLRMRDIQPQLQQKWLQLYWPDDSRWWPAQVTEVNPKRHRAHLLYETGVPMQLACDRDLTGCNSC